MLGKNVQSSVVYGEFGQVNSFTNTIGGRADTVSYAYDDFYRRTGRKLEAINKTSAYTYLKGNDGQDTVLVETLQNGKDTYKYTYDIYGNITSVAKNGTVVEEYEYDELNQLIYAKIGEDRYTYTYTENNSSNLQYVYKNGAIIKTYGYISPGETWIDKLTSFNGTGIEYDAIGNPLNWRNGMSFTWSYGRRLTGVTKGTDTVSYTYDANALRTSKTVNGTTTNYYWLDGVLQGQKTGNEHIIFLYDENGTAYGMLINNNGNESYYYYLFNLQGDIIGIMDSTGNTVVEYSYDAWGSLLSVTGNTELGNKNPLRYRGYYYDNETGLYYVSSRYYDPEVGRFISPDTTDVLTATSNALTDKNLYAYCDNNPVMRADHGGDFWHIVVGAAAGALISGVIKVVSNYAEGKQLTDGLATAMLAGAASGALASTGVGSIGMVVGNAAISMVENAANQVIENKGFNNFDVGDMLIDGAIGGVSAACGGAGKGTKHLTNLGKQTVKRTFNATTHKGLKAGLKEAGKAFAYYGKNSTKYYKNFLKGIPNDFISTAVTTIASSNYMKYQYRRVFRR